MTLSMTLKWRYLPERYGPWGAVWKQWQRWRDKGVWEQAMARLARHVRVTHGRDPLPSLVILDAQTVKGGRCGPTYHEAGGRGGRTIGAKRSLLIERSGLPIALRVDSARPHDVAAGRRLLGAALPELPRVQAVLADRGYRALEKSAGRHGAHLEIMAPPPDQSGFRPLPGLWRVENAFAQLGRWRRLSRCFEGTVASATAWFEVACVGYLLGRA